MERWGIDGSVAVAPVPNVLLYVFGSYLHSSIKDDVAGGRCSAGDVTSGANGCTTVGDVYYFDTSGNYESGIPDWTVGGRAQGRFGAFEIGAQVKYTGRRLVNDINTAEVGSYTIVDLDLRYSMEDFGLENTYFQLNLTNLFDEFYVGGFDGDLTSTDPFVQIGAPRAISASMVVGF